MRGFHLEDSCMEKQVDQMTALLKQNNIALPQREKKPDDGPHTEDDERCHALKASLIQSKSYLLDSGASNHMATSKEYFSTLTPSKGRDIHMGDESQIPTTRRGSIKIHHGEFKNVLYVPSLVANLLYVYQMTHIGSPKRVTFDLDSVEIT